MISARRFILSILVIIGVSCSRRDPTLDFAKYLQQEKRLRATIRNTQILEDSLKIMKKRYKIDPDHELMRLQKEPADWVELLRKLRRAK